MHVHTITFPIVNSQDETVVMSFGLKSSAECLEDHGLIPDIPLDDSCCEITGKCTGKGNGMSKGNGTSKGKSKCKSNGKG